MDVSEYCFKPHLVRGVDVFKLKELPISPTFVSANFVERWTSAGLVGLEFEEVWSDGC